MRVVLGFGLLFSASILFAETTAPLPAGCPAESHHEQHQFDFWIGTWEVTGAKGKIVGHSRIGTVSDGCGLSEHWEGSSGSRGVSYNAWDPSSKRWHAFRVGNSAGDVLYLEGGLEDGKMIMRGTRTNPATGKPQLQRITWTPNANGTVRQRWDQSDDNGKSWTISSDAIYHRQGDI